MAFCTQASIEVSSAISGFIFFGKCFAVVCPIEIA